ncbi:MAG: hypothetical protein IGS49_05050 [Chlorogloeopsis fritschii C42_A2020_084]|jgi:hypothetical protein|nr:hypothetical protein [Chlorogloeopsis fritschii C42_A2020_084]
MLTTREYQILYVIMEFCNEAGDMRERLLNLYGFNVTQQELNELKDKVLELATG